MFYRRFNIFFTNAIFSLFRPLGPLSYMRVWHDNSGKGKFASWYLNWIIVRDVQTGRRFYFIVNKWLAVEEEDGQVSY